MLVNIIDGKPEGYLTLTEAARKFRVTEQSVRNWCKRGYFDSSEMFFIRNSSQVEAYYISEKAQRPTFISKRGYNLKKKPLPYDYMTNVLNDVSKYYSLPKGEEISSERLDAIMEQVLSERDRYIVRALYDTNRSLREIGDAIGISAERVRQLKLRALRKISGQIRRERNRALAEKQQDEFVVYPINPYIYFEELNLSVRAWNCILRSNVKTLDEFLAMTPDQIIRIRNLGRKTYQEIIDKVHEHGYKFNWEE